MPCRAWERTSVSTTASACIKRSDTGPPRVSTFHIDKRRHLTKKESDRRKRNPKPAQVFITDDLSRCLKDGVHFNPSPRILWLSRKFPRTLCPPFTVQRETVKKRIQ